MASFTESTGAINHYFQDALGSTRLVVASNSNSACYDADFYPYGGESVVTSTCAPEYKFTGMMRDGTGDDHTQFRQYMSNFGRWASPDPLAGDITNPQSLNRYAYVLNNPTSLIDPFGLSCVHTDDGNTADDGDGKGCAAAGVNPDGTCTVPGQQVDVTDSEGPDVQPIYAGNSAGLTFGSGGGSVGAGGGHGGGGGKGSVLRSTKINLCKALQRARLVAQAGLSVGVVYVKIQGAEVAFAAAPATGGASAVVTGYLMIGAGGNAFSAGAQLRGAFSGDIAGADEAASLITTSTTATGLLALAISGNRETAAWWGGFESLATTGVNGGMTGHLIDESLRGAAKLVDMSDKAQNVLDFLGVDPGCGGG